MSFADAERSKDLHQQMYLTISVPFDVWFEALDIRTDDNRAAQTHRLAFPPKGYIKLVDKADFKPGSIAMRGNANCIRGKKNWLFTFSFILR